MLRLFRLARREPRLGLLVLDNLVTTLGASFTLLALPFLVMRLSGRALDLGVTAAIETLPSLCLLLFFPRWLDRTDPLRVLRRCRLVFVGTNLAICLLTWHGAMSIGIVYLAALIGGIVWAIAFPAGRAVFPLYVRKGLVPAGNAALALISGAAAVMLPLVAGSLVLGSRGDEGLAIAFGIDALCVAISLPLLVAIGRRGSIRQATAGVKDREVVNAASTIPRRFYTYLLVSSLIVFGPVQVLLPIVLVERHDARYLLAYVAQFAGIALASSLDTLAGADIRQVIRRILACWGVAVLGYLTLATSQDLLPVLLAFFLLAAASNVYGIQSQSWLQTTAPAHRLGQEMTWLSATTLGATPVAALLAGALVDAFRIAMATTVIALGIVVAIACAALRRPLPVILKE